MPYESNAATLTLLSEKTSVGTSAPTDDGLHEQCDRRLHYRCLHGGLRLYVHHWAKANYETMLEEYRQANEIVLFWSTIPDVAMSLLRRDDDDPTQPIHPLDCWSPAGDEKHDDGVLKMQGRVDVCLLWAKYARKGSEGVILWEMGPSQLPTMWLWEDDEMAEGKSMQESDTVDRLHGYWSPTWILPN